MSSWLSEPVGAKAKHCALVWRHEAHGLLLMDLLHLLSRI